jgi:hypothetical protein
MVVGIAPKRHNSGIARHLAAQFPHNVVLRNLIVISKVQLRARAARPEQQPGNHSPAGANRNRSRRSSSGGPQEAPGEAEPGAFSFSPELRILVFKDVSAAPEARFTCDLDIPASSN